MKYKAYIGTYSERYSEGIYFTEFDSETGVMKILDTWSIPSPAYLTISEGILYSVQETRQLKGHYGGGVASFTIGPDGSLTQLSSKWTWGSMPCHVQHYPKGKKLFVTNYVDGTLTMFNVEKGILGELTLFKHSGSGPDERRQKGPHAHSSQFDPHSERIAVADLGTDKVVFYNLADMMSHAGTLSTDGGCGPRHMAFSKNKPYAWVLCEMSNEVYAFETKSGKRIGVYSTLPKDFKEVTHCAAIKLSADEKRLYASNRGHDSIACFDINLNTGALSLNTIFPTGGKTPRDFGISPDGAYLYAANQESDNILVYKMENGIPKGNAVSELKIPCPVCVVFN